MTRTTTRPYVIDPDFCPGKVEPLLNSTAPITGALAKIRYTEITCWDIYRALTFQRISEEQLLGRHPELRKEDIAAVRNYAASLMDEGTYYKAVRRTAPADGARIAEQDEDAASLCPRCRAYNSERQNSKYKWADCIGQIND